jgi:hypothetical protein
MPLKAIKRLGHSLVKQGIAAVATIEEAKVSDIKEKVNAALHHAEKRIAILVLFIAGSLFVLAGLGKYLTETVPGFAHGLGYVFVGVCLLVVGFIGRMFMSE